MEDVINIQYDGATAPFWYIRLGAFLQYIQENILYIIKQDENIAGSPALYIDTDVKSNLMFLEDLQVSVDPNICVVNRTLSMGIPASTYDFTPSNAEKFESDLIPNSRCYGQIMNIYVHMKWILIKLDELKEANSNKVPFITFLNSILSSINSALGGMNNLEATIDESTNTIIIRDANPLPNKDKVIDALNTYYASLGGNKKISQGNVVFDLYGYTKNSEGKGSASFIKDFNFTTEISPELATMITVGATANSTVVGENSTAFSRFNIGLKDRFKKRVTTQYEENNRVNLDDIASIEEEKKLVTDLYKETYVNYALYIIKLSTATNSVPNPQLPKFITEEAETYKDAVSNFTTYLQQIRQLVREQVNKRRAAAGQDLLLPEFLPGTGFIPFNMSIVMDGMSGMKIYNKFNIDTQFLPSNYPNNAEFLIKNIVHKIENSKWFTTLESVVTIKGDFGNKEANILNRSTPTPAPPTPPSPPGVPAPPTPPSPPGAPLTGNAKALKEFFDTILKGESGTYSDHNYYVNGSAKANLRSYFKNYRNSKRYPLLTKDLEEYTIEEVLKFQSHPRDSVGGLFASGRYQITPPTLRLWLKYTSISKSEIFSPTNQDALAIEGLFRKVNREVEKYVKSKVDDTQANLEKAALRVAQIWSSVGVPYTISYQTEVTDRTTGNKVTITVTRNKNQSYYSNDTDRASVTTETVQTALKKLRSEWRE